MNALRIVYAFRDGSPPEVFAPSTARPERFEKAHVSEQAQTWVDQELTVRRARRPLPIRELSAEDKSLARRIKMRLGLPY